MRNKLMLLLNLCQILILASCSNINYQNKFKPLIVMDIDFNDVNVGANFTKELQLINDSAAHIKNISIVINNSNSDFRIENTSACEDLAPHYRG